MVGGLNDKDILPLSTHDFIRLYQCLLIQWQRQPVRLIKLVAEDYRSYLGVIAGDSKHSSFQKSDMLVTRITILQKGGWLDIHTLPQLPAIIEDIAMGGCALQKLIEKNGNECEAFLQEIDFLSQTFNPVQAVIPTDIPAGRSQIDNINLTMQNQLDDSHGLFQKAMRAKGVGNYVDAITHFEEALKRFAVVKDQVSDSHIEMLLLQLASTWHDLAEEIAKKNTNRFNSDESRYLINNAMMAAINCLKKINSPSDKTYRLIARYYEKLARNNRHDSPQAMYSLKKAIDHLILIDKKTNDEQLLSAIYRLIKLHYTEAIKAFNEENYQLAYIQCKQAIMLYKQKYNVYADRTRGKPAKLVPQMTDVYTLLAHTLLKEAKLFAKTERIEEALYKLQEAKCLLIERRSALAKVTTEDLLRLDNMKSRLDVQQGLMLCTIAKKYFVQKEYAFSLEKIYSARDILIANNLLGYGGERKLVAAIAILLLRLAAVDADKLNYDEAIKKCDEALDLLIAAKFPARAWEVTEVHEYMSLFLLKRNAPGDQALAVEIKNNLRQTTSARHDENTRLFAPSKDSSQEDSQLSATQSVVHSLKNNRD